MNNSNSPKKPVQLSQPEQQRRALAKTQGLMRQGKDTNLSDHKMGVSRGSSPYSRAQAKKKTGRY